MAHAIESMFSVKETPWHGLGNVVADAPTIADGIKLAGLDWSVDMHPVEFRGVQLPDVGKLVVRSTDGKVLGNVGPKWHPLQNHDAFGWFAPFIDSGLCKLETAGSLHGGRVVWVMASVGGDNLQIRPGDSIRKYLMLSNAHDGRQSIRVGFTPVRIVCANTLGMAHRDKNSALLRIKHTEGHRLALSDVRECVKLTNQAFEATAEQYRRLARRRVNAADLRRYVTQVLSADPGKPTKQEETKIGDVVTLALQGYGNEGGTLWDAYNGITQFLSYDAGRSKDTRLDSLWFGKNKGVNDYALQVALQLAV